MEQAQYHVRVDIMKACRYMGIAASPDEETLAEVAQLAKVVENCARPRVITKVLPVERKDGAVFLTGSALSLEGQSAFALLHNSDLCILFCATIGADIETQLQRWQLKDMAAATILDACASSAIENLCNELEKDLREQWYAQGRYLSDRFSPGYGDLPISVQKDFCAELDTGRKIGIFVTDSGIMIPRKSVTAFMGVSHNPQKSREQGCKDCQMQRGCKFRERGVSCYGEVL